MLTVVTLQFNKVFRVLKLKKMLTQPPTEFELELGLTLATQNVSLLFCVFICMNLAYKRCPNFSSRHRHPR